ncbi:MAG TPA: hypothetical protein PLP42_19525, partial [Acidobacteriota bacterium]|nr:hypothetical protein [Acidobacteriota bacterium]
METTWLVVVGIAGLLIGFAVGYLLFSSRARRQILGYSREVDEKNRQLESLNQGVTELEGELSGRQAELDDWRG